MEDRARLLRQVANSLMNIIWIFDSLWEITTMGRPYEGRVETPTCGEVLRALRRIRDNMQRLPEAEPGCKDVLKEVNDWIEKLKDDLNARLTLDEYRNLGHFVGIWKDVLLQIVNQYSHIEGIESPASHITIPTRDPTKNYSGKSVIIEVGGERKTFSPPFIIGRVEDKLGIREVISERDYVKVSELASTNPGTFRPIHIFDVKAKYGCISPDDDCTSRAHLYVYWDVDSNLHIMDISQFGSKIKVGNKEVSIPGGRTGQEVTLKPGERAEVLVKGVSVPIYIQVPVY